MKEYSAEQMTAAMLKVGLVMLLGGLIFGVKLSSCAATRACEDKCDPFQPEMSVPCTCKELP